MNHVTLSEKKNLVRTAKAIGITLNGEPAQIVDVKQKIPSVSSNNYIVSANWKTIKDVIENQNGEFKH